MSPDFPFVEESSVSHDMIITLEYRLALWGVHPTHAESQQDGVQETLALLLHFHHQQFEAVFLVTRRAKCLEAAASCRKLTLAGAMSGSVAVAGAPASQK